LYISLTLLPGASPALLHLQGLKKKPKAVKKPKAEGEKKKVTKPKSDKPKKPKAKKEKKEGELLGLGLLCCAGQQMIARLVACVLWQSMCRVACQDISVPAA
jgi:hypothetical protein